MTRLIEISHGLWARPGDVRAVRVSRGRTSGTLTLKPSVHVYITSAGEIGWEFDDVDEAMAWGAKITLTVNEQAEE